MVRFAVIACGLAGLLGGCGGDDSGTAASVKSGAQAAGTSATVNSADDQRRAARAVLRRSDLGPDWHSYDMATDPIVAAELKCLTDAFPNPVLSAEETGPAFEAGPPAILVQGRPFSRATHVLTSSVAVYKSSADARAVFDGTLTALVTQTAGGCLVNAEQRPDGPRVLRGKAARYLPASLPHVSDQAGGVSYRIFLRGPAVVYVDVFLLRQDRAVGTAFFSSMALPGITGEFTSAFVIGRAQVLGKRLAS
jgi:hypothetical protein